MRSSESATKVHPEAADGTRRTPQGIEDGPDDGHGGEPQQGRKVELVLVGRSTDDDEASDDVGMIRRELRPWPRRGRGR